MIKNWKLNKEYCKNLCEKNPKILLRRETKGGFSGDYLKWSIVKNWLINNYDYDFNVIKIKTSNDGSSGYILCEMILYNERINNELKPFHRTIKSTLALTLETFKRSSGEFYQETPEQLQMRVFVKLVANMTGFGFHLWEK